MPGLRLRDRLLVVRILAVAVLLQVVALLVGPGLARAQATEDDVRRVARQLRCPVCESVSVADSPAELAVQMRSVIRKKLEAGESDQQILEYFQISYGDSVLLEPPRRGLGLAVWFGPIVVLAVGAGLLYLILRRWVRPRSREGKHRSSAADSTAGEAAQVLARQELEALRRGLER